jgi:hypothetical protein
MQKICGNRHLKKRILHDFFSSAVSFPEDTHYFCTLFTTIKKSINYVKPTIFSVKWLILA